jgi:hypothetical protein
MSDLRLSSICCMLSVIDSESCDSDFIASPLSAAA